MDMHEEAQVLLRESKVENCSDSENDISEICLSEYFFQGGMHSELLFLEVNEEYGRNSQALESNQRHLQINEEYGRNSDSEVTACKGIIFTHVLMRRPALAIFASRRLLEIAKENGDKKSELQAYEVMVVVMTNCGSRIFPSCGEITHWKFAERSVTKNLKDKYFMNLATHTETLLIIQRQSDV